MNIYHIDNIKIYSVIRIPSEIDEGKVIEYTGNLQYYELIYYLSGKSMVLFQNITVLNQSGSIRFLPKAITDNTYQVKSIKSSEVIDIYFQTENVMPQIMINHDYSSNTSIRNKFIKIHTIWSKKEYGYYNKCLSLFFDILSEMEKSDLNYSSKSQIDKISNGIEYIHSNFSDSDFDYSKLPDICNISYAYFVKLFLNIFNVTPSEYIKNLKIQKATELLLSKRFSVTQVAQMCGYENIYYFSKVFKESVGVPPSEYANSFAKSSL